VTGGEMGLTMKDKNKQAKSASKPKKNLKEKIAENLELPKEIVLNVPKVILLGNKSLIIQNYKGILEYEPDRIKINTTSGMLRICGEKLLIKEISIEDIAVEGGIKLVEFINDIF